MACQPSETGVLGPRASCLMFVMSLMAMLTPSGRISLAVADAVQKGHAGESKCVPNIDDLRLAKGFCAVVFADGIGAARHLVVSPDGMVFAVLQAQRKGSPPGGVVALKDVDGDGHADIERRFGSNFGSDIAWHHGALFVASEAAIVRYAITQDALEPTAPPETIVTGFPEFDDGEHRRKAIAFDNRGGLYVLVAAPNNSCQALNRAPGSPGLRPCPYLKDAAGIWRFSDSQPGQRHGHDGKKMAGGIRNSLGMAWNQRSQTLLVLQEGRDELNVAWPQRYSDGQGAELPSEELLEISDKYADFGWPYCYHDPFQDKRVLAPEYGGDGNQVGDCGRFALPILTFVAHSSPTAIVIDDRNIIGNRQGGAYVSFHGGWGRRPFSQAGYSVLFVPFASGRPSQRWEVFAEGFAGNSVVRMPQDARFRPAGLAVDGGGHLYVADSKMGRIWRVSRES